MHNIKYPQTQNFASPQEKKERKTKLKTKHYKTQTNKDTIMSTSVESNLDFKDQNGISQATHQPPLNKFRILAQRITYSIKNLECVCVCVSLIPLSHASPRSIYFTT